MKVHFRGTRGSLPTAPTAQEIEEKIVASLMAARGKELALKDKFVNLSPPSLIFAPARIGEEILLVSMLKPVLRITSFLTVGLEFGH